MAEDMKNLLPVELKERIDYLSGQEIGHNGIYYVQDVGTKVAGKLYMCKTMKKIFRCKADNTLTYIDDSKYESMSLETLLDKLQNLVCVLFDRDTDGNQHLELKIGEYSIKCGYISEYRQGDYLYFSNRLNKRVYYCGASQHLSSEISAAATNTIIPKIISFDKVSFQYMSPNGSPTNITTMMWIVIGK